MIGMFREAIWMLCHASDVRRSIAETQAQVDALQQAFTVQVTNTSSGRGWFKT